MTDPKATTQSLSRMRTRNEICVALKRSSIIYKVYIMKNIFEVIVIVIFLPMNVR